MNLVQEAIRKDADRLLQAKPLTPFLALQSSHTWKWCLLQTDRNSPWQTSKSWVVSAWTRFETIKKIMLIVAATDIDRKIIQSPNILYTNQI